MNYKKYQDLDKDFFNDFPLNMSNPELFYGEGSFYLFEKNGVFFSLKLETKIIFKIATLVGPPHSKQKEINESIFVNELISELKRINFCDILNPTLHFFMCTSSPKGSISSPIGSLEIDLTEDEEKILKKFSSNYKNEIKKVLKEEWLIRKDLSLEDYYELYCSVQKRQNLLTYPLAYFKKVQNLKNLNSYLWAIEVNNSLEGFVTILQDRNKAYYMLGGATYPTKFAGSNKLLQFEIMKSLKQQGVKKYILGGFRQGDIEGTKYKGIQSYKKRFGAVIENKKIFYYHINPLKAKLYVFLLNKYLKFKGINSTEKGMTYSYEEN